MRNKPAFAAASCSGARGVSSRRIVFMMHEVKTLAPVRTLLNGVGEFVGEEFLAVAGADVGMFEEQLPTQGRCLQSAVEFG